MWRVCAALYIPGCLLALCTKISRTNATLDEVVEAAKAAHAHSLIERLPIGYDTVIGEEGSNFSQGQRQLPCIARVMLVLILDKATSSIDTRTELRVQKAFDKMITDRQRSGLHSCDEGRSYSGTRSSGRTFGKNVLY